MQYGWVVWVAVLAPVAGVLLSLLADSNRRAAQMCVLGSWVAVVSAVFVLVWRVAHISVGPYLSTIPLWTVATYDKLGSNVIDANHPIHPDLGLYLDNFAACALAVAAVVGLVVQLYMLSSLKGDAHFRRPFWASSLLIASGFLVIASPDLMETTLAMGFGAMMAAILLVHDWNVAQAPAALRRFFAANGLVLAAMAFACVIILVKFAGSSLDIAPPGQDANDVFNWSFLSTAWSAHLSGVGPLTLAAVALLLLFAATLRVFHFPLEGWVDALAAAPAPLAGVLLSLLFAGGGVVLLLRSFPLFASLPNGSTAVAVIGLAMALLATFRAFREQRLFETGLFLVLAQLGLIFVGVGFAWSAAAFGALVLSVSGTLLLLALSNVARAYRSNQMSEIRGVGKTMPATSRALLVGIAGISGFPLLAGWWQLEWILAGILGNNVSLFAAFAGLATVLVWLALATISWRLWFQVSGGEVLARKGLPTARVQEAESGLRVPLVPLQLVVVVGGLAAIPQIPYTFGHFVFFPTYLPVNVVWPAVIISAFPPLAGLAFAWASRSKGALVSLTSEFEQRNRWLSTPANFGKGAWMGVGNFFNKSDAKFVGGAAQLVAGALQYSGELGERAEGRSIDSSLLVGVAVVLAVIASALLVISNSFASGWLK